MQIASRVTQGMYKNRVKNNRIFFLNFPLFYLANEKIQSGKIQNNIYFLNFITSFYAEFPRSQDKREVISRIILSFSTIFLYIPCYNNILKDNLTRNEYNFFYTDSRWAAATQTITNALYKKSKQ